MSVSFVRFRQHDVAPAQRHLGWGAKIVGPAAAHWSGRLADETRQQLPIITIPWAIAAWRVARYALWPFARTIVDVGRRVFGSFHGNVIWVILAGWSLALGHIVSGIALRATIIGIPLGIAGFKTIPVSGMPLGKEFVSTCGGFDRTLTRR